MVKRVNVELSVDLHKKAKSTAALKGQLLKEFIRKAIAEKIDREMEEIIKDYNKEKKRIQKKNGGVI